MPAKPTEGKLDNFIRMAKGEPMTGSVYQKLEEERDGYRNGQAQLQSICDGLQDSIKKYADERLILKEENRRLRDKVIALEALLIDLDQVAAKTYQYAYELRRIVRDKIKLFLANLESAP